MNEMNINTQLVPFGNSSLDGQLETPLKHLLASLFTMAWFVEARDPYTGGHLWRVSQYSKLVAVRAGHSKSDVAKATLGGFLHDLGKIGIPDNVLLKNGKLTNEEYEVIKTHPAIGLRMLAGHPLGALVKDAVHLHHERPDGRGYPLGLAEQQIPEIARIIGICDAFDAMTSHRPYRKGMSRDRALSIVLEESGTQFSAKYVGLLIDLGNEGELDHIIGHSDDGIPLGQCHVCGPTLVISKSKKPGDKVYCSSCAAEFQLTEGETCLVPSFTGKAASSNMAHMELDLGLIQQTIISSVNELEPNEIELLLH
jgi:hypothetical protein